MIALPLTLKLATGLSQQDGYTQWYVVFQYKILKSSANFVIQFTPMDSLVFGGNFLHSWNMSTRTLFSILPVMTLSQLLFQSFECAILKLPLMSRKSSASPFSLGMSCAPLCLEAVYDFASRLCWYAGEKYLRDLKAREDFCSRVLDSIAALSDFLVNEARMIEGRPGPQSAQTEAARKEARDAVPTDKVKDAPALARELRWRVRNARGVSSGDEGSGSKRGKSMSAPKENGVKRKRDSADVGELGETEDGQQIFRNWRRKGWEREVFLPKKCEKRVERRKRPAAKATGVAELGKWVGDGADAEDDMNQDQERGPDDEAVVETITEVVVKVRRTRPNDAKGEVLERQRVERKVEVYKWPEKNDSIAGIEMTDPHFVVDEEKPITLDKQVEGDGISFENVEGEGESKRDGGGEAENDGNDEVKGDKANTDNINKETGLLKVEDGTHMIVDVQA